MIRQGLTFQVFHYQIVDPILVTNIVKSTYVRMAQGGDRARLSIEPLLSLSILGKMRRKDLYGNRALEPCITTAIHFSHAASPQRRLNLIRSEADTRREGH